MSLDRRTFLKWMTAVGAGALAVDQIELVERLTHERKLFPGWSEKVGFFSQNLHFAGENLSPGDLVFVGRDGKLHKYHSTEQYRGLGERSIPGTNARPLQITMELAEFSRKFGLNRPEAFRLSTGEWLP